MRILDRYLLREFGQLALYCLDAFALLWIVLRLFGTLDDFMEHQVAVGAVVRYYLVVLPGALVEIVPMALLLGLLFCLARLAKHNELLAMRAGGIGLARLSLPLLTLGALVAAVVLVVNVLFVPPAQAHANALLRSLRGKGAADTVDNLYFSNPPANRDWYVRRYDATRGVFENPEIHETTAAGAPLRDIFAGHARWLEGSWVFYDASVYDHTRGSDPIVVHTAVTNFPALTDKPHQLLAENKLPEEMSSRELRRAIRTQRRVGSMTRLAALETTLQYRYAFPLTCLMVVWIGIPLGMNIRRAGALQSVGIALALVVGFYFGSNLVLALGSGGRLPPALAAWSGNALFAVLGAGLMWRAR